MLTVLIRFGDFIIERLSELTGEHVRWPDHGAAGKLHDLFSNHVDPIQLHSADHLDDWHY